MDGNKSFLGAGWRFPPEFHPVGRGVDIVSEDRDIDESLRILFATKPGERTMWPTFGCGLAAMVFEQITASTVAEIRDLVERAVLFFEPRITLHRVDVTVVDELEGWIRIALEYTVIETNTRANMVYPFYVLEASGTEIPR